MTRSMLLRKLSVSEACKIPLGNFRTIKIIYNYSLQVIYQFANKLGRYKYGTKLKYIHKKIAIKGKITW